MKDIKKINLNTYCALQIGTYYKLIWNRVKINNLFICREN